MLTMTYNGIYLTDYMTVNSVEGRGLRGGEVSLLSVPGKPGAHFISKQTKVRELSVSVTIQASSYEALRDKIDDINGLISTDGEVPITFSDEPNRTYFGIAGQISESLDVAKVHQTTMTIVCPDPYKYGPEDSVLLSPEVATIVENGGTAPTKPVFELDILAPVTFAMVTNGDEYMMVGTQARVDETPAHPRAKIFHPGLNSMVGWVDSNVVNDGYIAGHVESDGTGLTPKFHDIRPREKEWWGPVTKQALPEPVQDFEMVIKFLHYGTHGVNGNVGREEVYGLDANNLIVFTVRFEDIWYGNDKFACYIDFGNGNISRKLIVGRWGSNDFNNMHGTIKVKREGNEWNLVLQRNAGDGTGNVVDEWQTRELTTRTESEISQVQVGFQKFHELQAQEMRMDWIKVFRLNDVQGTPYIADSGDKILLDFQNDEIRLNGEMRKDLKRNLGARPFALQPGENSLVTMPTPNVEGVVKYRPAFK